MVAPDVSHSRHLLGFLALTGSGAFWTCRQAALVEDWAVSVVEYTSPYSEKEKSGGVLGQTHLLTSVRSKASAGQRILDSSNAANLRQPRAELSAVNIVGQDPPLGMVSSLCNQDHANDIPPTLLVCFPAFFFDWESS